MPHITVYYEIIANMKEDGNYDEEHGEENVIDCTPDEYDIEDGLSAIDLAVKALRDNGANEPSSSQWYAGTWYYTPDAEINYRTGESTTYSFHLKGFAEEEEQAIYSAMRGK